MKELEKENEDISVAYNDGSFKPNSIIPLKSEVLILNNDR